MLSPFNYRLSTSRSLHPLPTKNTVPALSALGSLFATLPFDITEASMKTRATLASLTLLLFGSVGALTVTAQSQDDSKDTTAKHDAKDAGHDTKDAAKKAA